MQVDPIKPTLKAPGSKRLKLEYEKLLSNCAIIFRLRRYSWAAGLGQGEAVQVDPVEPMLKAPGNKRLKLKFDKLLSSFAYNFNLRHFTKENGCRWNEWTCARAARGGHLEAGAYTRPLSSST